MLFKDVYNCPCVACVFEKPFLPIQNIREFGLRNGYSTPRKTRKRRKNARRRSTKCRKRRKTLVVGRRNAKNAEKRSSSVDEIEKMVKISFPPWLKLKKRQKSAFRHGG